MTDRYVNTFLSFYFHFNILSLIILRPFIVAVAMLTVKDATRNANAVAAQNRDQPAVLCIVMGVQIVPVVLLACLCYWRCHMTSIDMVIHRIYLVISVFIRCLSAHFSLAVMDGICHHDAVIGIASTDLLII